MKTNTYRGILIAAVLVFTFIYIVPTAGWMTLDSEERAGRLKQWNEEDGVYAPPKFFDDTTKGVKRWFQFDREKVVTLGLDLQGGVHMVVGFELTPEQLEEGWTHEAMQERVLRQIRRRINQFEAKDPIIQSLGDNQIQIQLPGEKDIDRAKELIMKTAYLSFHVVAGSDETLQTFAKIGADGRFKDRLTPFLVQPKFVGGAFRVPVGRRDLVGAIVDEINATEELLPEGKVLQFSQPPNAWDDEQYYELYVMGKTELMSGEGLRLAMAREDNERPGKYQIIFEFDAASANTFGKVTEANIGNAMAIVVDGAIVSAPTIESKITRSGRITGNFSSPQAYDLAIALSSGALPVPIQEEYSGVVSASLGTDSIRKGTFASLGALIAIALFMAAYYRIGGLVACVALLLNGLIMLAAFAYFRLTLTLPGIAGFVLTMGMAVDANVLIFERVREEVRNGKTLVSAIELGYRKATVTILDANVTTLIAALVLLQFGTGPVQGFGVALAIGICTSVFTALVMTLAIFDSLTHRGILTKLSMASFMKPDTHVKFIESRRTAFTISIALIAVCVTAFFVRGYENNFGVDFKPGTSMIIHLDTADVVQVGDVRANLADAGFENANIQEYGGGADLEKNSFVIKTGAVPTAVDAPAPVEESAEEGGDETAEEVAEETVVATPVPVKTAGAQVKEALASLTGGNPEAVHIERENTVGPAISGQLRRDALKAVFFSLVFMVGYMWFRYNLVFGITAIIALLHDAIISVGLLSVFGPILNLHIDMTVIAAVLTIIGYSVNDTVVVFDRIREDLRVFAGRELNYAQIMNLAINQTLSRTILTSGLTFLAVIMLFFFGGDVLHNFSFCLIIGVIVGTFSSIFVASSLAYVWQNWSKHHLITGPGPGRGGRKQPTASKTRKRGRSKAANA